ncbi:MAG: flagellar assembly protein FliW [Phycisphaerales bacterium]|nr:flagellar assembly protein FliW [Phycisphaerales bacterium]
MLIETSRFGPVEIDAERLITFREGILGFARQRVFTLLQTSSDVFYWLQSVDDPALAFVVCDPRHFVPDYQVPVRADDVAPLGLTDSEDCQVLVIVNKVEGVLTANLLGPLVIGATSRLARQFVLADKRYSTRHVLLDVSEPRAVARSA